MFRLIRGYRSVFIGMAVLAFLIALPLDHALAALVDTQSLKTDLCDNGIRERLLVILAREEVRVALLKHGVDPTEVEAQIAALTDLEVLQIRETIGTPPAGGMASIAPPIGLVILGLLIYILIITGVISVGSYAGVKLKEQQEEEYAKSTPFPAPPRVGPLPSVNPNEPWTGKWKVSQGRLPGVWSLAQNGDTVISTADSDFKLEAKVYGAMIRGKWSTKGVPERDFQATIAEDGLSFNGAADYAALRDYFTAKKIE